MRHANRMLGGLTLRELSRRTWRDVLAENSLGRAAELAYYFTLAFFPMLIFLLSVISFIPEADQLILGWLKTVMPADARKITESWMVSVFATRNRGLLSFSLIFSLWAASNGVWALMAALNRAYEVEEGRPYWKAQLIALGLTITLSLLIMGGAFVITFGEKPAGWIIEGLRLGNFFGILWLSFTYLVGFTMLAAGMGIIYYVAPNVQQHWSWIVPGSLFALLAFLAASFLFSLYLRFAPSYDVTYGSLGAFIVLMVWLYLLGLIMCIGGEINAQIQYANGERVVEKEKPESEAA
jgi:membrane protein